MKLLKSSAPMALLPALLLLAELPAAAQTIPSNYRRIENSQEAGVFIGTFSGGTGRFGFGPKTGLLYGGRWAIEIGGPFSFEGTVGWIAGTRDVIDPELAEGTRMVGEADIQMGLGEVAFKFAFPGRRVWHGLSPHLTIGGGVTHDFAGAQAIDERILENDRYDFGTGFLLRGGGGFRWFLNDRWSARADGVVRIWQLQSPPGFGERQFENAVESEWTNGLSLTVGLAWRY